MLLIKINLYYTSIYVKFHENFKKNSPQQRKHTRRSIVSTQENEKCQSCWKPCSDSGTVMETLTHKTAKARITICDDTLQFPTIKEVRWGDTIFPKRITSTLGNIIPYTRLEQQRSIDGELLRFPDDIVLISNIQEELQQFTN